MKKYLVEFIGTFFLTLTFATAGVYGSTREGGIDFAAVAIGLVLMAMCYCGGHVSGGHYNPAATLAVFLRGRCEGRHVLPYIASQLLAAIAGAIAASILTSARVSEPMVFGSSSAVLLSEFLFTFALCHTLIHTTTARATEGNSYFGIAIGGIFMAGVLTVGPISLGSFNPAVSLMLAFTGRLSWIDSWMHLLPQLLAAVSAAYAFKVICPEDR